MDGVLATQGAGKRSRSIKSMTRKQLEKELKERGYNFKKFIFHEKSPYQSRRYRPEYVGWEAWLYGKSSFGFLITQEEWENQDKDYQLANVEAFNH